MKGKQAMTLMEVLVSVGLISLVSLFLLAIFGQISSATRLGDGHLAVQQRGREVMRRSLPTIRRAIAPNAAQDAIYAPAVGATASTLSFSSTEDLLNPAAPPFDPRAPVFHLYNLRYVAATREVLLEDTDNLALPARTLGREVQLMEFTRVDRFGVRVRVNVQGTVRSSTNVTRQISFPLESVVSLPQ